MLENLMQGRPGNLYFSRHVKGNGKESFAAACGVGMDVVAPDGIGMTEALMQIRGGDP